MRHPYRIFRTWIWEILSVAFAVGLISAIVALLASYHGKEVPDWGVNLNFNALLAFLSTILRAMLVVIVSQIICQQKWEWFGGVSARPLSDLQRFDSGSRGSFGALLLIPTVLLKDITALVAAIVLVASFLVGPFVQQASRTMVCTYADPGLNASLPYAHYIPRRSGYNYKPQVRYAIPETDTVVAILSAATAPDGVENQISTSCSTGNCTFPDGDPRDPRDDDFADKDLMTHSTVGMCNTCVDVTSLVSRKVVPYGNATTLDQIFFTLPTGRNVSNWGGGSEFASINPESNLDWLGDMLTPELRAMSRWAYVNATFLEGRWNTSLAATCVLYPCLRTYTASVTNNQLSEKHVRSQVMQIDMFGMNNFSVGDMSQSKNAESNLFGHYVTVKSPCLVDGHVYETQNMSHYSGGTKLDLFDFTGQGGRSSSPYTFRNITAPEQCIYRQNALFVNAISIEFRDDMFDGVCSFSGSTNCRKRPKTTIYNMDPSMISSIGANTVLSSLLRQNMTNVTRWFDSFADAMTNRFRFEYGATDLKTANRTVPSSSITERTFPPGQVRGLAWQNRTCISTHWQWLLLPICLTLITAALAMKTIATNWQHRRIRPVWKDSILPFIFYGHKIESHERRTLPHQPREEDVDNDHSRTEEEDHLLEATEMNAISEKTLVTFRWPDHAQRDESDCGASFPLQQEKSWLKRRSPREKGADSSLLETTNDEDQSASNISHTPRNDET